MAAREADVIRTRRIDAHHHLWAYNAVEFGWISDEMRTLRRDFLVGELEAELAGAEVDGTVVVQARQTVEETEWLLRMAEASARILGVVGWLPIASPDLSRELERLGRHPLLKGVRHVVQAEAAGFLQGTAFNDGISMLRGTGLVYDLLLFAPQLEETIRFVDRHPEQSFVLDHLGKPAIGAGGFAAWRGQIGELALRPNVVCKVSGMVTETDWTRWTAEELEPYFEAVLKGFGPWRLMIGTDWPVLTLGCSYRQWWQTVEAWVERLSDAEKEAILGGTAERIYHLSSLA